MADVGNSLTKPADLAMHVFDELVHHGAEVSLLRDLCPRGDQPSGR